MNATPAEQVLFILLPGHGHSALAGMLDALAEANRALGKTHYEYSLASEDGLPVRAGNGIALPVQGAAAALLRQAQTVFVLADVPLAEHGHEALVAALREFARAGGDNAAGAAATPNRDIGGVGTGAWLLARAGLLEGHRATLHWPYTGLLAESFPGVVVSSNLFEVDGQGGLCMTAAGGDAGRDLVIHWLAQRHGDGVAGALMDHFGLERRRGPGEAQRAPLTARIGGGQPKLTEAVSLMEANLEEPLPTEDIARLVGVSRRQLERLFKQYLDNLPSRYYLDLRLNRSRQLLMQTSQSILQIGLSCGFSSGPHFSSAYRARFGITPREQRARRLNGAADAPGEPDHDA